MSIDSTKPQAYDWNGKVNYRVEGHEGFYQNEDDGKVHHYDDEGKEIQDAPPLSIEEFTTSGPGGGNGGDGGCGGEGGNGGIGHNGAKNAYKPHGVERALAINPGGSASGMPPGLLNAVEQRESGGDNSNVGDVGLSRGSMQIQKDTWDGFRNGHQNSLPPNLKNASWDDISSSREMSRAAGGAIISSYHDEWLSKGLSDDMAWKCALRQYNSGSVPNPNNPNERPVGNQPGNPGGYVGVEDYVSSIWGNYMA